jgi:hypothetical protein
MSEAIDARVRYAEQSAQKDDRIDVFDATKLGEYSDDEYRIHIEACEVPSYIWALFAKRDVAFDQIQSSDTIELTFTYNGG